MQILHQGTSIRFDLHDLRWEIVGRVITIEFGIHMVTVCPAHVSCKLRV